MNNSNAMERLYNGLIKDYYGGTGIEQYDDFHAAEYYSG